MRHDVTQRNLLGEHNNYLMFVEVCNVSQNRCIFRILLEAGEGRNFMCDKKEATVEQNKRNLEY